MAWQCRQTQKHWLSSPPANTGLLVRCTSHACMQTGAIIMKAHSLQALLTKTTAYGSSAARPAHQPSQRILFPQPADQQHKRQAAEVCERNLSIIHTSACLTQQILQICPHLANWHMRSGSSTRPAHVKQHAHKWFCRQICGLTCIGVRPSQENWKLAQLLILTTHNRIMLTPKNAMTIALSRSCSNKHSW